MDFKDQFRQLAERVVSLKEQINTEEATKNAFIMPFIQMLGYDVFNPLEVVPELDCDLVKKKGEKIDYAIKKDGDAVILIECKHWKQDLNLHDTQLQRYFVASKARFGILTNGIVYRFYTDLEKPNIMDVKPFLEIDLENIKDYQIEEVKKFHKSYFDTDNILSTASELKYMAGLKAVIRSEFAAPTAEMVKLLSKRVYNGVITPKLLDQFTELVKRSLSSYVNEVISERLNVAINTTDNADTSDKQTKEIQDEPKAEPKIITTEEELEGFYIVKSIVRCALDADRITYRDAQSYFAIFADDNNRRPICRLYFNNPANKKIGIFNEDKQETVYKLENLDGIFEYQDALKNAVAQYVTLKH